MTFYDMPLGFWTVGLNFTVVYVALQLACKFFSTGIKKRNEPFGNVNFPLAFAFIFVAAHFINYILSDYFSVTFDFAPYISIFGAANACICIWMLEPLFRKNFLFTILAAIDLVLFIVFNRSSPFYIIALVWIAWDFVFLFLFLFHLMKSTGGGTRKRLLLLLLSTGFLIMGWILTLELEQVNYTLSWSRLIGYLLFGSGLIGMNAVFYRFDLFIESGWRDAIEELYIIHSQLLQPLYYQNLKVAGDQKTEKVSLFSESLVNIDTIMKSIAESQAGGKIGVVLIAQEGKFLLIEHSFNALVCFVVNKNLKSLRYYLREIRVAWDLYYSSRPIDWGLAQQEVFGAMHVLVNRILKEGRR